MQTEINKNHYLWFLIKIQKKTKKKFLPKKIVSKTNKKLSFDKFWLKNA